MSSGCASVTLTWRMTAIAAQGVVLAESRVQEPTTTAVGAEYRRPPHPLSQAPVMIRRVSTRPPAETAETPAPPACIPARSALQAGNVA
ncbi:MAG TPA: hypothetical protein VF070_23210 [Streptosporangiaceae bacterium]